MRLSIIVAMGHNRVIGDEHGMPWHLPADLKRFRRLTMGKPLIMGRKTAQLIGKPLAGRTNIVLTRQPAVELPKGFRVVHRVEEALEVAQREAETLGVDEVMVIGGGEIYREFLPLVSRMYLTLVEGEFAGSATFPQEALEEGRWVSVAQEALPADERNAYAHEFVIYDRHESGSSNA